MSARPRCPTCGGPLYAERENYDFRIPRAVIETRCLHCGRLVAEEPVGPDWLAEARARVAERPRRGRPPRRAAW